MERQYSEEAARDILKRAVDMQVQERDFTETQLREMAEELGISETVLARAQQSWLAERETTEVRSATIAEQRAFEAEQRSDLQTHIGVFVLVNTFLFLLNLLTGPGTWWFIYPFLSWGLGLAIHVWTHRLKMQNLDEEEFLKWRAKRQIKRKIYRNLSS